MYNFEKKYITDSLLFCDSTEFYESTFVAPIVTKVLVRLKYFFFLLSRHAQINEAFHPVQRTRKFATNRKIENENF